MFVDFFSFVHTTKPWLEVAPTTLTTFFCNLEFWLMTLTYELDLNSVKLNQLTKLVEGRRVQRLSSAHTVKYTRTQLIALPWPLKWSIDYQSVWSINISDSLPVNRQWCWCCVCVQCAMPCDVTAQHCDVICSSTPHVSARSFLY